MESSESWKLSTLFISLALLAFSIKAHAAPEIPVRSLSQGACWVENTYPAKVASFNDAGSFVIEQNFIFHAFDKFERELLSQERFKISHEALRLSSYHVHCSGQGAYFIINAPMESGHQLCAWFDVDDQTPQLSGWGVSEGKGFCYGHAPGELIVGLLDEFSFVEQMEKLTSHPKWSNRVEAFEQVSDRVAVIYLKEGLEGEEANFVNELQELDIFRYVEVENNYRPVGDSLDLFKD